jgi:hypothetical protein
MRHKLQRLLAVDDAAAAFAATNMCLRHDTGLLRQSLADPNTRWYANHTAGYVRFVRRKVEDSQQRFAWLLDVSYTRQGKVTFHPSSVTYMLEASELLAQESRDQQLLYADRQLARLFLRHMPEPAAVEVKGLPPVMQPICKYRHDGRQAEEFSRSRIIPDEGRFYVLR